MIELADGGTSEANSISIFAFSAGCTPHAEALRNHRLPPPPPSILGRRGAQRRTAHDGAAHGGSPAARGALWEAEGKNMADGEEP